MITTPTAVHVIPVADLTPHGVSAACWCAQRVETHDPETGDVYAVPLIIHTAQDGRDLIERHGVN